MRFWIDCDWVHLSVGGQRIKSLRSRFTINDLTTLLNQGAVPVEATASAIAWSSPQPGRAHDRRGRTDPAL